MTATAERLTATITGRVQGVGFRWWVVVQAGELGLTGWVTNDDDERTVTLVAEGPPPALEELARRLGRGPTGARVERVESSRGPASGEYHRFQISRG
jgi:acylphosphatase